MIITIPNGATIASTGSESVPQTTPRTITGRGFAWLKRSDVSGTGNVTFTIDGTMTAATNDVKGDQFVMSVTDSGNVQSSIYIWLIPFNSSLSFSRDNATIATLYYAMYS